MNNTHLSTSAHLAIDQLFKKATSYIEEARNRVQLSINAEMVQAYWFTAEQEGQARAAYGSQLLQELSNRLTKKYGKGFRVSTLRDIRQFYLVYPNIEIHHAVRGKSSNELSLSSTTIAH